MNKILKSILLMLTLTFLSLTIFSQEVSAASTKLSKPQMTISNVASTGKIKISWKPVKKAVAYEVYRSRDGETWTRLIKTKNTSVTNTSAEAGVIYYYKVRALASKSSSNSAFSTVKYRACDLARPEMTLASNSSTGKIIISWKSVDKAVAYEVYRSRDGKTWTRLIETEKTSVTNTSAEAGKRYYYKVRALAKNSTSNSAFSKAKYRTCDLARPEITLTSNSSTGKTIISWKSVEKAVSYKVYYSTDNKNWKLLKSMEGTKLTHTSATYGKKYYYKVKAISSVSAANSAYSSVKYRTSIEPEKEDLGDYQKQVVDFAIDIAKNWKTDYRQGEKGKVDSNGVYGFDCSGFATYVMDSVMEKEIPTFRITSKISEFYAMDYVYNEGYPGAFKAKTISLENIQPGDVIFFSHNKANDHCGIYIGDNKFVHCTKSNDCVAINSITGYYKSDLSKVRRYIPTEVKPANTKKTISKSCGFYKYRADDDSRIKTLKSGSTVTVLFTGNRPADYNQAYVKTSDGTKGYVYTKNLK